MDRAFLNMLRSVAEAEKHPTFRTKNYGVFNVDLMYPENVIVVASPTGKAPPPAPGETRVTKLSHAVHAAVLRAEVGAKRCSILVHEGIYVDALHLVPAPAPDPSCPAIFEDFALEIVGTKNVRLIFDVHNVHVRVAKLTLRNLLIYDHRPEDQFPTINLYFGASADFIDVVIQTPGRLSIACMQETSLFPPAKVTLRRSVIMGSGMGVQMVGSELRLEESLIGGIGGPGVVLKDAKIEARGSSILNCDTTSILLKNSSGIVENCTVRGSFTGAAYDVDNPGKCERGIELVNRSQLSVRKSLLKNFRTAVSSTGSHCKPVLQDCAVNSCFMCMGLEFNSDALVEKCELHCEVVLMLCNNVSGNVEFRKNKMSGRYKSGRGRPTIMKDKISTVPRHDFKGLTMNEADVPAKAYTDSIPTKKERSDYTKWEKETMYGCRCANCAPSPAQPPPDPRFDLNGSHYKKVCNKCCDKESPWSDKFKYCKGCQRMCYCSKKCQADDWPDHKLICRSKGSSKH